MPKIFVIGKINIHLSNMPLLTKPMLCYQDSSTFLDHKYQNDQFQY